MKYDSWGVLRTIYVILFNLELLLILEGFSGSCTCVTVLIIPGRRAILMNGNATFGDT